MTMLNSLSLVSMTYKCEQTIHYHTFFFSFLILNCIISSLFLFLLTHININLMKKFKKKGFGLLSVHVN